MIKVWKQVLILLAVFIAGIFIFSRLTNHETKDLTADMAEATFPILYFTEDEQSVNELHAYAQEMDAASMRDTITPVGTDGMLPIRIDSYGNQIKSVRYEVRSLDTTRLVQQSEVQELSATEDTATAEIKIENLLNEGQEYLLIVEASNGDADYYFYTRIIKEENSHIEDCISFVRSFHDITMDKSRQAELASYMEPSSEADNATLQTVTINNSLSQVCWGDFSGEEVSDPVVSVKELNDSYNVILLNYVMASTDESGEKQYYNVEEYYRVRYGTEKMYLLSFERTVEEIFGGAESVVQGDSIDLGIRSADVDFKANETGTVVCFVQQGELWSFNIDADTLTKVYSFRSEDKIDSRENYGEHDIRIIRANESGSIDFIVYGYMNRGDHEGQVGISVCHYDSLTNTVEEQLFIPFTKSYQIMKEEIGQMMYISDSGKFYLTMGDQIHEIDLETMEDRVFLSGLTEANYVSSEDGRYLAWTEGSAYEAEVLHLTDFSTGETYDISADSGCMIRPLGFLESDCVYGLAAKENVSEESSVFAMNQIIIVNASEESGITEQKRYQCENSLVTSAAVEDGSIYMNRVLYSNGVYVETEPDTIHNRDMQEEKAVYLSENVSDTKEREVVLQLAKEVSSSPNLLIPKLILPEESTALELSGNVSASAYYVYAKGKVLLGTDSIAEAVRSADENRGVVIGSGQTYIWKRAKAQSQSLGITAVGGSSARAKAVSILLNRAGHGADADTLLDSGQSVYQILQETVSDKAVYNLTGCTLEQTLYFVGTGMAVYAERGGQAVLITGYDDNSVTIYDPSSEQSHTENLTSAVEAFAQSGNIFYTIEN